MRKNLIIFGTRPEFIKLIPVFEEIKNQGVEDEFLCLFTGQQEDIMSELFSQFDFSPEYRIPFRNHCNHLGFSLSYLLSEIQNMILKIQADYEIRMIIGQGDTTSCTSAAMSAFFNNIPFMHIEAGLRSNDHHNPFPEEYFRKIISMTAAVHFAPTIQAENNLLQSGITREKIILTGNTIVDVIEMMRTIPLTTNQISLISPFIDSENNILITCHRRENQNVNFYSIANSVNFLANENPDLNFIWISHTSPILSTENVKGVFKNKKNIFVVPPIGIAELYALYNKTKLIITDSGGIQEEAPSFDIPVIVIRMKTERMESVNMGYAGLIDDFEDSLIQSFRKIIHTPNQKMNNPYGDGKAAERIVSYLRNYS